ncbi:DUF4835 family protein [uncultured Muribaculum sp.]|uniref:type IX secretion system protein PorD n=1 Tax=uncultured Muribaculum sp. TaxID=1918613 RepID=UPI0025F61C3A|nr:DUF4835 family protein [uncultured Muribaculum sp.]
MKRIALILRMLLVVLLSGLSSRASAQELNCKVEIDFSQVPGTNTAVFTTLQDAISEYINTRKWTNAQFSTNEKIDCKLFLAVKTYEDPRITGELQIQSSRPVYNSNYTTTIINFKDTKIEFDYSQGEPLIFSENSMESNLTAIINYYVYLVLALDFDSFSPRGGDPYWERLNNVVQMAQSAGEGGWKSFEDTKNRAAVLNAFTEPSTQKLRDMLYAYHRTGLDEMSVSPDKGRQRITQSLDILSEVSKVAPMSVGISLFKDAKLDELVNVYSKAPQDERERVYELLYSLYPTEGKRLDMIKKGTNKQQ